MKTLKLAGMMMLLYLVSSCNNNGNTEINTTNNETAITKQAQPVNLNKAEFIEKVFDFEKSNEWAYKGDLPCVIDFYADWCRPCKMVSPIMDELADKYVGKVRFYKINTDREKELAMAFNIQSIPTILFIPKNGQPKMSVGLSTKEEYTKIIDQIVNQ